MRQRSPNVFNRGNIPPQNPQNPNPNQQQPPQRPQRTPQQIFTQTAATVKQFANQPLDMTLTNAIAQRVNQQKTVKTQEMGHLLGDAQRDQDEDIRRKVFLVFDSKDKKYAENVQQPCDEAITAISELLQKGSQPTPELVRRLEVLMPQLEEWRVHYADTTGIKTTDSKMLQQRQAKVAAIVKRKQCIQAVLDKVGEIQSLQGNEEAGERATKKLQLQNNGMLANVTMMAANLLSAPDQQTADEAVEDLAKLLANVDAVTRRVLLAELPDQNLVIKLITKSKTPHDDAIVADYMKAKGNDRNAVSSLVDTATHEEISQAASKQTMFRGNCAASKLATASGKSGPSKDYVNSVVNKCMTTVLKCEYYQTHKPNGDSVSNPKEYQIFDNNRAEWDRRCKKQLDAHKKLARDTVDEFTQTPLPPELAEVCGKMYTEAARTLQGVEKQRSAQRARRGRRAGHRRRPSHAPIGQSGPECRRCGSHAEQRTKRSAGATIEAASAHFQWHEAQREGQQCRIRRACRHSQPAVARSLENAAILQGRGHPGPARESCP